MEIEILFSDHKNEKSNNRVFSWKIFPFLTGFSSFFLLLGKAVLCTLFRIFYYPNVEMQTQAHPVVIYSIIHASINIKVFLLCFFLLSPRQFFFLRKTDEESEKEERFMTMSQNDLLQTPNTKAIGFR